MNIRERVEPAFEPGCVFFFIASAVLLFSWMPSAAAQTADIEKFSASLGAFFTSRDTVTRLDGDVPDSGTEIDLESDFGIDESESVFRVDGYYRFNERHRLGFSVFYMSQSGSKQVDKDIVWNGTLYPVDVRIDARVDMNIRKLAYTWSFMQRANGYLGVSLGVYVGDIGTSIAAESIGEVSSGGVTAPLPVVGLVGQYDFSESGRCAAALKCSPSSTAISMGICTISTQDWIISSSSM